MTRAFVFPGQGAQTVGMGRELAAAFPAARAVFDEVDAALGEKLSALIWEGDIGGADADRNAQPALMATSIAALRAMEAEGLAPTRRPSSPGTRSANIRRSAPPGRCGWPRPRGCCGCADRRCRRRCRWASGAMAALLGLDLAAAEAVAAEAAAEGEVCEAANDNDPAQVVVRATGPRSSGRWRSPRRGAPSGR